MKFYCLKFPLRFYDFLNLHLISFHVSTTRASERVIIIKGFFISCIAWLIFLSIQFYYSTIMALNIFTFSAFCQTTHTHRKVLDEIYHKCKMSFLWVWNLCASNDDSWFLCNPPIKCLVTFQKKIIFLKMLSSNDCDDNLVNDDKEERWVAVAILQQCHLRAE
jgi:hypothetical protein